MLFLIIGFIFVVCIGLVLLLYIVIGNCLYFSNFVKEFLFFFGSLCKKMSFFIIIVEKVI